MFHKIEEAIIELQAGKIVIVVDDEDRENEGDFVALADNVTPDVINFMIKHGRGLVCMPITEGQAKRLDLSPMVDQNTDPHGTAFTVSVDYKTNKTGISAFERADTVNALLSDEAVPTDFKRPGHTFPLIAREGGVLKRAGHTEAAVDLSILCGVKPGGVICEIIKEDGTMARVPDLLELAAKFDMKIITIKDLIDYRNRSESLVKSKVKAE